MRLSPAIARIAGWPIETANGLRSPRLADDVDQWLRDEDEIRRRAPRLSAMLYTAVPRIADKSTRATVLRLRRAIHRSIDPLPNHDLQRAPLSGALAPDIARELRADASVRTALMQRRHALESAYGEAFQRETAALCAIAKSADFLKALCVSSPSLFDAWTQASQATRVRGKLLCKLLRYVMRAVGRCTPNGLWSGIVLESSGEPPPKGITVARAERQVRFSPCLELLVPMLRAVHGGTRQAVLPGMYSSAWRALESAAFQLPRKEVAVWLELADRLRAIAAELEASFANLAPADLRRLMGAARECVNATAERYDAARVRSDAHVLVADSTAPFTFRLSGEIRRAMAGRLEEYWHFDRYGLGEALATAERSRVFGTAGSMQFSDWLHARGVADWEPEGPTQEAVLRRWHDELQPVYRNRTHRLRTTVTDHSAIPHGSALLRLQANGSTPEFRIGPVTPDPCLFYSRFHNLFGDSDAFARWYRSEFQEIEQCGHSIAFADLAAYSPVDANAAVRRKLHRATVDLSSDGTLMENSRLELGPGGRARWVAADGLAIVPLLHSAVALDEADPYAGRVHLIAHLLGRPSLMSPLPVLRSEQEEWGRLPRLYLGEDTVVSPERWIITAESAAQLAASRGFERFVTWRRLAGALSLPAAVYQKHYRAETELLMYTDSVLAVENLGSTIATYPSEVRLQEAFPAIENSWVVDEAGRHYLAEIAIAWAGEEEFWTEYSGGCSSQAPALAGMRSIHGK